MFCSFTGENVGGRSYREASRAEEGRWGREFFFFSTSRAFSVLSLFALLLNGISRHDSCGGGSDESDGGARKAGVGAGRRRHLALIVTAQGSGNVRVCMKSARGKKKGCHAARRLCGRGKKARAHRSFSNIMSSCCDLHRASGGEALGKFPPKNVTNRCLLSSVSTEPV